MATLGRTHAELTKLARDALRDEPGCKTTTVTSIDRVPELKDGRNWTIGNVFCMAIPSSETSSGAPSPSIISSVANSNC